MGTAPTRAVAMVLAGTSAGVPATRDRVLTILPGRKMTAPFVHARKGTPGRIWHLQTLWPTGERNVRWPACAIARQESANASKGTKARRVSVRFARTTATIVAAA